MKEKVRTGAFFIPRQEKGFGRKEANAQRVKEGGNQLTSFLEGLGLPLVRIQAVLVKSIVTLGQRKEGGGSRQETGGSTGAKV